MSAIVFHVRRCAVLAAAVSLLATATGCIRQKTIVTVKPDGSGRILVSMVYSKEVVAMQEAQMAQMREAMAAQGGGVEMAKNPYYNPRMLHFLGRQFGLNVKLAESRAYNKGGARGFLALYEFEDVNALRVSAQMNMSTMAMSQMSLANSEADEDELDEQMEQMMESMADQFGGTPVTFKLTKGDPNRLEVVLPDMEAPVEIDEADLSEEEETPLAGPEGSMVAGQMMAGGNPFGFTANDTESQMMRKMMNGMSVSLDIAVQGAAAKAEGATPRPGKNNRWIVYDIDFEKLVADRKGYYAMKGMEDHPMAGGGMDVAAFGRFAGMPGTTVQTNDFTITF